MAKRDIEGQARASIEHALADWLEVSGDEHSAFRDWAVEQVLWGEDVGSRDDIQDITAVDGPNDFGIDGWHYSQAEGASVLYVIQAKDTAPKFEDLTKLRQGLLSALDPITGRDANDELRQRAFELRRDFSDDLRVEFHLVTSRLAPPQIRRHAETMSAETLRLFERDVPVQFEVHDIARLSESVQAASSKPIDWSFAVAQKAHFEFRSPVEGLRTVIATIPAMELVEAYAKHKANLFKGNPRYSLGVRTKVNEAIIESARTTPERFYLYNNGLTALCATVQVTGTDGPATLSARDVRVVNGCQTTISLHEAWRLHADMSQVNVLVRFIEAPRDDTLIGALVKASNTQNKMRAEDFRSNDQPHQRLHDEMLKMQPPWFYENKRGVWTTQYKATRDRLPFRRAARSFRKVGMKDLAQALLAFRGDPATAIEKAGEVIDSPAHDQLFPLNISAMQALLPHIMHVEIERMAADLKATHSYALYLRYPVLSFVARILHELTGVEQDKNFDPRTSTLLASTVEEWLPLLAGPAFKRLVAAVEAVDEKNKAGARSLVRTSAWLVKPYGEYRDDVLKQIEIEDAAARKAKIPLNEFGLRAEIPVKLHEVR